MNEIRFGTDPALCINSWNARIADLTGRPADSVIGIPYYEVLPPFMIDGKDALSEAARKQEPLGLKGYRINCLTSGITADITISPQISPEKGLQGISVTVCPASTCAIATKLSASEQLIRIGKVASSLAHGVRNPLNAIKGAVVYLNAKYAHDASLTEFTGIMEQEISKLESFISRFLSSSVIDAEPSEVDLNAMLSRIEALTALQLQARNITAIYELGSVPPIAVTSFHIEQSVLNVINNAIEAMTEGGQLLVKTYTTSRDNGTFAVIEISDTGPGIADVELHAVSPSSVERGRGFGLFITCEILKHYQGHLDIDSKKGCGTTVRMSFPASRLQVGVSC